MKIKSGMKSAYMKKSFYFRTLIDITNLYGDTFQKLFIFFIHFLFVCLFTVNSFQYLLRTLLSPQTNLPQVSSEKLTIIFITVIHQRRIKHDFGP